MDTRLSRIPASTIGSTRGRIISLVDPDPDLFGLMGPDTEERREENIHQNHDNLLKEDFSLKSL